MNDYSDSQQVLRPVAIAGTGVYLPKKIVTNDELAETVDTSDEWIRSRTGICERCIADDEETVSYMGAHAVEQALEAAGLKAEDIDLIYCASISPEMPWPNTGCLIQDRIGAVNAACMGLEAACTGFVYAIEQGWAQIACGAADVVAVVATEKLSTIVDWSDRQTCVLFGDGSGCVILRASDVTGLRSSVLGSDGSLSHLLHQPAGGSLHPATEETVREGLHFIKMSGRETFKNAVSRMVESCKAVVDKAGVALDDVDWIIPHQANERIIKAIGDRVGGDPNRVIVTVDRYANTSSATIPVALHEAVHDGRIKKGDKVLLVAFGGGFTWGAILLEWAY